MEEKKQLELPSMEAPASAAATAPSSNLKKWGSLLVMSLALAIIIIDTTLLNVSLRTIIQDLNTDLQKLQWVITSYALILTAFTITGGRLGDLFGRKRMFVAGAAIFAVGSLIASLSHSVGILLLGESIIEGIGAALMMPATASLLVSNFKGRERGIAFGVWGGVAAASSAIGPILGGFLTTHYSWRWGFRINVAVAALLIAGSLIVRESQDREEKPSLDFLGVVLSSLGLLSVVWGVIESETYGWFFSKADFTLGGYALTFGKLSIVPFAIVLGLDLLALFFVWEGYRERHGKTPLVSLELFQNRQFSSGALTTGILSLGQTGMFFTLPVFLQAVRGLDALHTGLALLPMSLTMLVLSPLSAIFLSRRIAAKHLIQLGLLADIAAIFIIRMSITADATVMSLAPGLMLYAVGMALIMPQISNLTLSAVSVEEAGEASGVNNTLRQLGSAMGSAILGAVLLTSVTASMVRSVEASTKIPAEFKPQIETSIRAEGSSIEFGGKSGGNSSVPGAIGEELRQAGKQAIVDGNRTTMIYTALFILLGLLASLWLPDLKNVETERSAAHRAS